MSNIYRGNKPCPGCGLTGAEKPRLSKDGLCHECRQHIRIGKELCEERSLERKYYILDDLRTGYMTWYQIHDKKIDTCLRELLKTFSRFDQRYAGDYARQETMLAGSAGSGTSHDGFVLPAITFEAAKNLCKAVEEAAGELAFERNNYKKELESELAKQKNDIYNEGVAHGRNLLFALNNGEITLDDFAKRINKYGKEEK